MNWFLLYKNSAFFQGSQPSYSQLISLHSDAYKTISPFQSSLKASKTVSWTLQVRHKIPACEMTPLKVLTEQNLGAALLAPREPGNTVDYSKLRQFEYALKCTRFSIKYVLRGAEHYRVNGQVFPVRQGEYLLLNPTCDTLFGHCL